MVKGQPFNGCDMVERDQQEVEIVFADFTREKRPRWLSQR